jgi:hypothetical protein
MEVLTDYDCEIKYHPGKANVVADTLSGKDRIKPLRVRAMHIDVRVDLMAEIRLAQERAIGNENVDKEEMMTIVKQLPISSDGLRRMGNKIWVPMLGGLRNVNWKKRINPNILCAQERIRCIIH